MQRHDQIDDKPMGPLHYTDQHLESQKDGGAEMKLGVHTSPCTLPRPAGVMQSLGSQRVRHDLATGQQHHE